MRARDGAGKSPLHKVLADLNTGSVLYLPTRRCPLHCELEKVLAAVLEGEEVKCRLGCGREQNSVHDLAQNTAGGCL